ncbi:DUF2637 domain-containing protein [Streptomyces mayonensis]|uniref:DUF2637 domain-containing protein n=1 Tax=Streptomyces mayonensis TaxID=2750816 RepID=UPI001C1E714A|nr:DUF2637 domain-containing protein [Streptomyces sp. A108]MBU6529668.1 DUF2637 domain-containing protein [Streptomyces sp. A108]
MNDAHPLYTRITSWDRAAIVALGAAGCALSYDALQQMATAIHIRGILTFVFPLVIDGFIAYGVRALLVLRTAPLAARCYVWFLFGTATAASIWANALHAVRLNQQHGEGDGLRLGDVTVGVLSTLAPLALAGAVHLYILIARRVTEAEVSGSPDGGTVRAHRAPEGPADAGHALAPVTTSDNTPSGYSQDKRTEPEPEHGGRLDDMGGQSATRPLPATALPHTPMLLTAPKAGHTNRPDNSDQKPPAMTDDQLLSIARPAVTQAGRLTRKVVGDAIRSHDLGLGNDRLTNLMRLLRQEAELTDKTPTG